MPSASCCFFACFVHRREINTKWSPNAAKLFVDFFGPEDIQWAGEAPGGGGLRGEDNPPGRTSVGAAPLEQPLRCFLGPLAFFWPKKILQEFRCIWTPFDIDFLRCKNMQKTATVTWHYVNRLVAKNDIK